MDGAETWLTAIKLIGAAIAAVLIGLAGLITGRNRGSGGQVDGEVVAATFTERAQMERLTSAMTGVESAVRDSHAITVRLVDLLERDEQRRHDEAVIRKALKERGIVE